MDPLSVGQRFGWYHSFLLDSLCARNWLRSELATARWWLAEAASGRGNPGGFVDLIAVQTEISEEVFAALHGLKRCRQIQTANAEAPRAGLATRR